MLKPSPKHNGSDIERDQKQRSKWHNREFHLNRRVYGHGNKSDSKIKHVCKSPSRDGFSRGKSSKHLALVSMLLMMATAILNSTWSNDGLAFSSLACFQASLSPKFHFISEIHFVLFLLVTGEVWHGPSEALPMAHFLQERICRRRNSTSGTMLVDGQSWPFVDGKAGQG